MTTNEIRVRVAERADASRLLTFLRQAATESQAILLPGLDKVTVKEEAIRLASVADRNDCLILLACLGEEIVGVLTIMHLADQPGVGELGVIVAKDYWHQGIGRLLVDESQYWYENYSILDELMLTVFTTNQWAIKLYQDLGFQTTGQLEEPMANGELTAAYRMVYQK